MEQIIYLGEVYMSLRLICKTNIAIFMLITSTLTLAKTNNDQILCPSPITVRQGALVLDDYLPSPSYKNAYFVSSESPAFYESGMPWYVHADNIISESTDKPSILKAGMDVISKANNTLWKYAFLSSDKKYYFCSYGPGDIGITGIIQ